MVAACDETRIGQSRDGPDDLADLFKGSDARQPDHELDGETATRQERR